MFNFLKKNQEHLLKSSDQSNYEGDLYEILFKTGQYIIARDIIYLIIIIFFLIKLI